MPNKGSAGPCRCPTPLPCRAQPRAGAPKAPRPPRGGLSRWKSQPPQLRTVPPEPRTVSDLFRPLLPLGGIAPCQPCSTLIVHQEEQGRAVNLPPQPPEPSTAAPPSLVASSPARNAGADSTGPPKKINKKKSLLHLIVLPPARRVPPKINFSFFSLSRWLIHRHHVQQQDGSSSVTDVVHADLNSDFNSSLSQLMLRLRELYLLFTMFFKLI